MCVPTKRDLKISELAEIARRFRGAILGLESRTLSPGLRTFPKGSCGDASLLLGAYLIESGYGHFDYVVSEGDMRSDRSSAWRTHAWLEREGIVIDITADQFAEFGGDIYVGPSSSFHSQFHVTERGGAHYRRYRNAEPTIYVMLDKDYKRIMVALKHLITPAYRKNIIE